MLKYIHYRANNVHPYITGKLEDQKTQLGEKKKKEKVYALQRGWKHHDN